MRAYGLDLRDLVVHAHQAGEGSIREWGDLFHVAKNTVDNWLRRLRESGTVVPRPHGGGVPAVLSGDRLETLCRLVVERDDATLDELREAVEQECQVHTSRSAVDRALRKVNFTRKRRRSTRTSATGPTSSRPEPRSARSKPPAIPRRASSSTSSGSTST